MRIQHAIDCKTEEKRELLKEKINLAKGLINSDTYSTIIKALDLLSNSILQQMNLMNLKEMIAESHNQLKIQNTFKSDE